MRLESLKHLNEQDKVGRICVKMLKSKLDLAIKLHTLVGQFYLEKSKNALKRE